MYFYKRQNFASSLTLVWAAKIEELEGEIISTDRQLSEDVLIYRKTFFSVAGSIGICMCIKPRWIKIKIKTECKSFLLSKPPPPMVGMVLLFFKNRYYRYFFFQQKNNVEEPYF